MARLRSLPVRKDNTPESFRRSSGLFPVIGRELQQSERGLNIVRILHPEADPAGARKYMVRQGAAVPDELGSVRHPNKTIKQAIPVNVAALGAVNEKSDATEAVDAPPHPRPSRDR